MPCPTGTTSAGSRRRGASGTTGSATRCGTRWRGATRTRQDLATRLAGSEDVFGRRRRRPSASINFVTSSRRLHAHRPRLLRAQAQRRERRGRPRRHRRQPLVELRRRRSHLRRRRARPPGAPAPQPARDAAGGAGRADAARRRRARPDPARQQQRLPAGQRGVVDRLGGDRSGAARVHPPDAGDPAQPTRAPGRRLVDRRGRRLAASATARRSPARTGPTATRRW